MKRFISLLIVLAMMMSPLSVNVFAESEHIHDSVVFTAWSDTANLPTAAGNYYLTADVQLDSWETPSGEVTLCLCGHSIACTSYYSYSTITVPPDCTLNIYDCSLDKSGAVKNDIGPENNSNSYIIDNHGTLNVYSGTISNSNGNCIYNFGTLNVYDGTISSSNGHCIHNFGTLNVYDGTISHNLFGPNGIWNSGSLTVYGGSISGITNSKGGTHYFKGKKYFSDGGDVIVYGGTISSDNCGILNDSKLTVYAGTISAYNGSGISNQYSGTVTVHGGTISANRGTTDNNINNFGITNFNTLTVNGGTINGVDDGISNSGTLTVNGGTISGYDTGIIGSGTLTVNGGYVSGNNFYGIWEGGITTVTSGNISGGQYGIYYTSGDLKLSGNANISGTWADIIINDYYNIYITVTGKLENANPYTIGLMRRNIGNGVFTNTGADDLKYNDPEKFAPNAELAEQSYAVTKNDDGQLAFVLVKPEFDSGDLNGDGAVNITDAIELLKYVAKLDNNVVNKAGADVDGNGTVNINDAIYLLKMIAKLI